MENINENEKEVQFVLTGEGQALSHLEAIFLTLDLLQISPRQMHRYCEQAAKLFPSLNLKSVE